MKFSIIGAAGYVAARHVRAIHQLGGELVSVCDIHNSMGLLDSFFPACLFFDDPFDCIEFSRKNRVDYMVICSPNHLHFQHIKMALHEQLHVICEKPLVIQIEHLQKLSELEKKSGKSVHTILQLRCHPAVRELKQFVKRHPQQHFDVDIEYITPRGDWYSKSWKGDEQKSGGILFNIGIHLFDLLCWVFGLEEGIKLHPPEPKKYSGVLQFHRANVRWMLSLDRNDLPANKSVVRSMTINGKAFSFADGFHDLHLQTYKKILTSDDFRIIQAEPSLSMVHRILNYDLIS